MYMPKPYKQPALSVENQIKLLAEKGLIISDQNEAARLLSYVSYFRLRNYSFQFKNYEAGNGNFIAGTTFEQIAELYAFDQRLKLIIFEAVENIEVAIKTQVSNLMSYTFGPHWYLNRNNFLDSFNFDEFIHMIRELCEDHEEPFINRYMKGDFEPDLPPSWMIMEIITFGTISRVFEHLSPSDAKNSICEHFGLPKNILVSWLHSFTYIRNKCSHHSKLVYKAILFSPAMPQKKSRVFLKEADLVDNTKLYSVLCCIQQMLKTCNTKAAFKNNLLNLITDYSSVNFELLGFTPNWREEEIWR